MYAGYVLGVNWESIAGIIGQYNKIVIVLTVLIIVCFIAYKFIVKKRVKTNV